MNAASEKIRRKNLQILERHYPNIYRLVKSQKHQNETIAIESAKSGDPTLRIQRDGNSPIYLHSRYNPLNEANLWVNTIAWSGSQPDAVLVFGFGLGYHVERFIQNHPDTKLYIYEPYVDVLTASLAARDLRSVLRHPNIVSFAVGREDIVMRELLELVMQQISGPFEFIHLPVYQKLDPLLLEQFHKKAKEAIFSIRGNLATLIRFQQEWSENLLFNLVHLLRSSPISGFKDCCKGIPALIVGSGPSLQEDIHLLQELKEHCLIIAAGSSVQALLHHGIQPHLVAAIDGSEAQYNVFHDLDMQQIPLLYAPIVKYKILDQKQSLLLHAFLNIDPVTPYLLGLDRPNPVFYSSATVTGIAVQAAAYFGCTKIIFMGQDLSYPNNQLYAKGVDHFSDEEVERTLSKADLLVENVAGGKNKTTQKMMNTLHDLETLLMLFPGAEFINTSKYGARIKGTRFLPLASIAEELKRFHAPPERLSAEIFKTNREFDEGRAERVLRNLNQGSAEIREMEHLLDELEKEILQTSEHRQSSSVKTSLLRIDQLWTTITKGEMFNMIYSVTMHGHLSVYKRYVPKIAAERDLAKKAALIRTHLGRLVAEMKRYTSELNHLVPAAIERIQRIKEHG